MMDLSKVRSSYIACGYTDLRLGIDGLAAVVTQQYGGQLNEESLFLFCGRRTDRIKALCWTGDGYILLYKRLSNGGWPAPGQTGIDVGQRRDFPQPCHHGKLGDPVQSELAETSVQAHEAGASDPFRDPRR